jgi:hypothetical protein
LFIFPFIFIIDNGTEFWGLFICFLRYYAVQTGLKHMSSRVSPASAAGAISHASPSPPKKKDFHLLCCFVTKCESVGKT